MGTNVFSILDNAAAVGDSAHLRALALRWMRRTAWNGGPVSALWAYASNAAACRAEAIDLRLAGNIAAALTWEDASEREASRIAR